MKLSKKKIMHAHYVLSNNLIDFMKKYKVFEELKDYGIEIDVNSSVDLETARAIYKRLCENLCKSHKEEIENEFSKEDSRE